MSEKNKNLPSEFLNSRPELQETKIGIFKGIYSVIPLVGPMINEILFDTPNRIYQSRINHTVEILKDKISELDNSAIDEDYLKSEDFFDFSKKMIENSLKIKSKIKKTALADIYIQSFRDQADFETNPIRLFLDFVADLSIIQINLLKFIEINKAKLTEIGSYTKFYNLYNESNLTFNLEKNEFKYYINDLENKSLISLGGGLSDFMDSSRRMAFEDHKDASVVITDLGDKFIYYLKK